MELPDDPDSDAYRQAQMKLYEWLHGKPYATANEVSAFDIESALARPFPYSTASPKTVGDHLIGIGHVIRTLDLKPGQSVLEFGPGLGKYHGDHGADGTGRHRDRHRTQFRRADPSPRREQGTGPERAAGRFLDDRSNSTGNSMRCCSSNASTIALNTRPWWPRSTGSVAPGGKVLFAAEPILDQFPIPWGLRLDGESLWAIRKHGWLELGFQETYFRGLLARHGWQVAKVTCPETLWGNILVATRANG